MKGETSRHPGVLDGARSRRARNARQRGRSFDGRDGTAPQVLSVQLNSAPVPVHADSWDVWVALRHR
jgi:hypothetical protein